MAVFATEGRFGQLLAKTCVALLLGWHVYALLLPYLLLGMVAAFRRRDGIGARRHLTLGVVALTFGTMVLATNFVREYLALGGEVAPTQLPSVESMLMRGLAGPQAEDDARVGAAERSEQVEREWPAVAARQLKRIAWSVPYDIARIEAGSATKRRTSYGGILRRASYDVTWEGSFSPRRAVASEAHGSARAAEESP